VVVGKEKLEVISLVTLLHGRQQARYELGRNRGATPVAYHEHESSNQVGVQVRVHPLAIGGPFRFASDGGIPVTESGEPIS
jgi:hypothetical protein